MGFTRYEIWWLLLLPLLSNFGRINGGSGGGVQTFEDLKSFKKFLRTHVNVLALFQSGKKEETLDSFLDEAAKEVKGIASIIKINCASKEAKKICKKFKVNTKTHALKHFKDGAFNKDYDRQETLESLVNFLRNPTGELAWKEDQTAMDVVHIENGKGLNKLLKKTMSLPALVMFYAPWCGHCKTLKPDFAAAATQLKGKSTLAGMDVENHSEIREKYNITGFPTLLYFEGGDLKFPFGGDRNKESIIKWMKAPEAPKKTAEPEKEVEWSEEPSEVKHLEDETFLPFITQNPSVLVMFYAPWCGHCKSMKPEYVAAAAELKAANVPGILAALDAQKWRKAAEEGGGASGYPTIKYFKDGVFAFERSVRKKDEIVSFMKDPKEPPPPPPPEHDWAEEETDVVHLGDDFQSTLKKRKHALVMFYAPWCGHCKSAKPHLVAAAARLAKTKGNKATLAAVDCTKHDALCSKFEVRGYPTFQYLNYGKNAKKYEGGREEEDFLAFMEDPANPKPPAKQKKAGKLSEESANFWKSLKGGEAVHLITEEDKFDEFIKEHDSVLVMFYAPWCGHCKNMKPAFAQAATMMATGSFKGKLVAVDATVSPGISDRYEIRGFPTLKHFVDGAVAKEEYNGGRDIDSIVSFMKEKEKGVGDKKGGHDGAGSDDAESGGAAKRDDNMKDDGVDGWDAAPEDVAVLNGDNLDSYIEANRATFVIFYAPWCGYCKRMKSDFFGAAAALRTLRPEVRLGAVDATQNRQLTTELEIQGYPTMKLFLRGTGGGGGRNGGKDYNGGRNKDDILQYLKDVSLPGGESKEEL